METFRDRATVTVYVEREERDRLAALATRERRSLSNYIRELLREHLRRAGKRARIPTPGDKP